MKKILIIGIILVLIVVCLPLLVVIINGQDRKIVADTNTSNSIEEQDNISKEVKEKIIEMYNKINVNGNIEKAYYFEEYDTSYLWVIYNINNDILYCTISFSDNINTAEIVKHYGSEKTAFGTFKEINTAVIEGLEKKPNIITLSHEQLNSFNKK